MRHPESEGREVVVGPGGDASVVAVGVHYSDTLLRRGTVPLSRSHRSLMPFARAGYLGTNACRGLVPVLPHRSAPSPGALQPFRLIFVPTPGPCLHELPVPPDARPA